MSDVVVILNCRAGSQAAEDVGDRVRAVFRAAGINAEVMVAGQGVDVGEAAKRAIEGGATMVVAGGGDGTINAVASAVVGTDVTLGVLPLGTLNHFARDLSIPSDIEAAVRNLVDGRIATIDVGEVNGRVFLNNSSIGLYPSLVRHREQQQMRLGRGKWAALFWSALLMLRRYPLLRVRIVVEGKHMTAKTPVVFIGNNDFVMTGLDIGGRERLDGGNLSLYMPRNQGRFGLVRIALRALFKRKRRPDDFVALRAREFTVDTTRRRVRVATDGEVSMASTPLNYRIRPGVLKVRVPVKES
jgi:YegS/Rv2252/BmrU family lipid kinase